MARLIRSLFRSARTIHPELTPRSIVNRARIIRAGIKHRSLVQPIINAPESSSMNLLYQERPSILGVLVWPLIIADWSPQERLGRVADHYDTLDLIGAPFPFSIEERLVLLDLDHEHPKLRLVLDQPRWFIREGGLTLNLFVDCFRAYSIAFAYSTETDGSRSMLIGGIQGRNTDDALDIYRDLTKSLHGMRPRDFLIYALQILARATDVRHIYAVTDAQRHHRHAYFPKKTLEGDYDKIWEDRSAIRVSDHFYELPLITERRDIDEIKSKKKSLYRKRYEFLDWFEAELPKELSRCKPVRFVDL